MSVFGKTIKKIFGGDKSQKDIKNMSPLVEEVNTQFELLKGLSNDQLRNKTQEFKAKIAEYLKDIKEEITQLKSKADSSEVDVDEKETIYQQIDDLIKQEDEELEKVLKELLPFAFAVVKETARRFKENSSLSCQATDLDRELSATKPHIVVEGDQVTYHNTWKVRGVEKTWDMLHYDVQIIGGIALHDGKIAEMATGEGKTLVSTLPAYLNAITEKGVHIITVNNYLATRDAEWNAPLYEFLGLTVDCIDLYRPHSPERRKAYTADITYGTNNEFGFDYLRDNMVMSPNELVQGKLHYAMIDEVDSVLIDDARTPLIISGPVPQGDKQEFHQLKPRIERIFEAQRRKVNTFIADAKQALTEGDKDKAGMALLRAYRGMPKNKALIKLLSEEGVKQLLLKTENLFMQEQNKRMPEIDQELLFVIEEKRNSVELTDNGVEFITQTGEDKSLFVLPHFGEIIAELEKKGLTPDELQKEKDQAVQEYAVRSERVHSLQQLLKAYAVFEKDVEYVVMDGKVKIVDEQTGRIMEGRRYSDGLHQAIEAKENVKVEAATQTFATVTLQNFFRMYHKLAGMTGTAETEAGEFWEIYKLDVVVIPTNKPIARDDRNDLVYKTKRAKFNAVIEEILNLRDEGRPVLVGTTSVEVSELLSRTLKMKNISHNVLNAKQHQREADIVAEAGFPGVVTIATNMAGRGTDIKISEEVKAAGGLAIIGTERHESRRVDRQLRGRAGRQGDPGSSQFFVCLEDNLMRLFGSERIAKIMDRIGYKEDEVIQHSMITKSIERAQKKVEENNFGIRKNLLEYDDVMNTQRTAIYKKRKHALFGDRLSLDISNTFYDTVSEIVNSHHEYDDFENFQLEFLRSFSMDHGFNEESFKAGRPQKMIESLFNQIEDFYQRKNDRLQEISLPVMKDIHINRGATIENVAVPFSDGKRAIQVVAKLEDAVNTNCATLIKEFEKTVSLALIDEAWKGNLRQLDDLKQSVRTASFEQKDPILIYKLEAFEIFKEMMEKMNKDVTSFLFKGQIPVSADGVKESRGRAKTDMDSMKAGRDESANLLTSPNAAAQGAAANAGRERVKPERIVGGQKVGRNEPCPCGSGKKYKQCHGKVKA